MDRVFKLKFRYHDRETYVLHIHSVLTWFNLPGKPDQGLPGTIACTVIPTYSQGPPFSLESFSSLRTLLSGQVMETFDPRNKEEVSG